MVRPLMVWPRPSKVPLKRALEFPTGTKPPEVCQTSWLVPVADASMFVARM